ncbi:hypothetical protein SteCoe_3425 [Stentor coeruleus]|uniref:Granulins domain-containing protein n=1 Tax=Stentor coeruleus TaxID=5963 RepID=A0A1R2CX48_9CILI|nr:hypothetical protein SteCoe_3425 [Stentor coeruleus]
MALWVLLIAISLSMSDNLCDREYRCKDGETCCKNQDNTWTCCPFAAGICCPNTSTCCPSMTTCISGSTLTCANDPFGFLASIMPPTTTKLANDLKGYEKKFSAAREDD